MEAAFDGLAAVAVYFGVYVAMRLWCDRRL